MENRCVVCGAIIPEGRQICPNCENGYHPKQERNEELDEQKNNTLMRRDRHEM